MILYAVIVAGLLQGGYGVLQWAGIYDSNHQSFVATGSFVNPGPFGGYIGIALSCAIGTLFCKKNQTKTERICLFISILVLGVACVISDSRAAWMGVTIAVVSMVVCKYRIPKKRYWIVGIPILFLIMLYFLYLYRPISADARILIWKVCGMMIQEQPFSGAGIGTFASNYMNYQAIYLQQFANNEELLIAGDNVYAFNEYIKILCEHGLIGLLFLILILFTAFRTYLYSPNDNKLILFLPSITYLIFSFFSYPSDVLSFYLLFPLLLGGLSGIDDKAVFTMKFNKWVKLFCISLLVAITIGGYRDWLLKNEVKRHLTSFFFKNDKKSTVYLNNTFPDYQLCLELVLQYSNMLFLKGEYKDAILPLKQVMALSPSSTIACDLGSCYQYIGHYEEAETYFTLASRMVPGLITPKYLLFSMYITTGQQEKARDLAKDIVEMPVKQTSERTEIIKLKVKDYLKSLDSCRPDHFSGQNE